MLRLHIRTFSLELSITNDTDIVPHACFDTTYSLGVSEKVVQHPNVVSCPHLGASTVEAQKRVAKEIAEQILSATKGESLFGAVSYFLKTTCGYFRP